jgi:hypothetical protein
MKTQTPAILATFTLLCLAAIGPKAQAVSPPPDGGYPGGNTAEGDNALLSLTTGAYNTAVGLFSLLSNNIGSFNTALGAGTLLANTANENTATGAGALLSNTTGFQDTANGAFALFNNTEGNLNTAIGAGALVNNIDGNSNTATGAEVLQDNISGGGNTAIGRSALLANTTGDTNTAIGLNALQSNTTGSGNVALGAGAGAFLTTGDDNIDIGNFGVADDSSTIRIGNEFQTRTFIAAIRGVATGIADAIPVLVDSNGQLGTLSSSRRFKRQIKPIDQASEAILALQPMTFHYKSDKTDKPQFGLIAEEVAKVNPDLVVRDENGEIYTVRYDAVNAMLLNEFLKEHRRVQEQEVMIKQLKEEMESVLARLQEHDSRFERVSNQMESDRLARK